MVLKWECHWSLMTPRNVMVNEGQSLWSGNKVERHIDEVPWWWSPTTMQRGAKTWQCRDTTCNGRCKMQCKTQDAMQDTRHSMQQTQTTGNANATKGAMPQTQPSKCAKHKQRLRHKRQERESVCVWLLRQTVRTLLSANEWLWDVNWRGKGICIL